MNLVAHDGEEWTGRLPLAALRAFAGKLGEGNKVFLRNCGQLQLRDLAFVVEKTGEVKKIATTRLAFESC